LPSASSPLSLHDALPIFGRSQLILGWSGSLGLSRVGSMGGPPCRRMRSALINVEEFVGVTQGVAEIDDGGSRGRVAPVLRPAPRSEEHTSELQSRGHLVC